MCDNEAAKQLVDSGFFDWLDATYEQKLAKAKRYLEITEIYQNAVKSKSRRIHMPLSVTVFCKTKK